MKQNTMTAWYQKTKKKTKTLFYGQIVTGGRLLWQKAHFRILTLWMVRSLVSSKRRADGWDDVQILEVKMESETTQHTCTNPFKVKCVGRVSVSGPYQCK